MSSEPLKAPDPPIISFRNELDHELEVWCEPFCETYLVPPGSVLLFRGNAEHEREGTAPVNAAATKNGITLWFEHASYAPDAELDGNPVDPV
ncbi:MAG TPA: hypothetical protein VI168_01135 [Croceibacterium sp.]